MEKKPIDSFLRGENWGFRMLLCAGPGMLEEWREVDPITPEETEFDAGIQSAFKFWRGSVWVERVTTQ